jgi:hypothetical protein
VLGNYDKFHIAAPTIRALWYRFYNFLPVTGSAFSNSLKDSFLMGGKKERKKERKEKKRKKNHFSVHFYCLFLLVLLHLPKNTSEDAA